MNKIIVLAVALSLTGCAGQRYTLNQIRDYDQAIKIADSNGMDTKLMHDHLVEMVFSYAQHPGEDEYTKAARMQARAMQTQSLAAIAALTRSAPFTPPLLSPSEYRQASR